MRSNKTFLISLLIVFTVFASFVLLKKINTSKPLLPSEKSKPALSKQSLETIPTKSLSQSNEKKSVPADSGLNITNSSTLTTDDDTINQWGFCQFQTNNMRLLSNSILKKVRSEKEFWLMSNDQDLGCLKKGTSYKIILTLIQQTTGQPLHPTLSVEAQILDILNVQSSNELTNISTLILTPGQTLKDFIVDQKKHFKGVRLNEPLFLVKIKTKKSTLKKASNAVSKIKLAARPIRTMRQLNELLKKNNFHIFLPHQEKTHSLFKQHTVKPISSNFSLQDFPLFLHANSFLEMKAELDQLNRNESLLFVGQHPGDYQGQNFANLAASLGFKESFYFVPGVAALKNSNWSLQDQKMLKVISWKLLQDLMRQERLELIDVRSNDRRFLVRIDGLRPLEEIDRIPANSKFIFVGLNDFDLELKDFIEKSPILSKYKNRTLGLLKGGIEEFLFRRSLAKKKGLPPLLTKILYSKITGSIDKSIKTQLGEKFASQQFKKNGVSLVNKSRPRNQTPTQKKNRAVMKRYFAPGAKDDPDPDLSSQAN